MSPLPRLSLFGALRRRRNGSKTSAPPMNIPSTSTPSASTPVSGTPSAQPSFASLRVTNTYPSVCLHCPKRVANEAARSLHVQNSALCRKAEETAFKEAMARRAQARADGEELDLHREGRACIQQAPTVSDRARKRVRTDDAPRHTPTANPPPVPVPDVTVSQSPNDRDASGVYAPASAQLAHPETQPQSQPSNTNVPSLPQSSRGWTDPATGYFIEPFPDPSAGEPISDDVLPPIDVEAYMRASGELGQPSHFEMAELLLTSGMSNKDKNRHLKSVLYRGHVPWNNSDKLFDDIDRLRHGPTWHIFDINVPHDTNPRVQYIVMRDIEHVVRDIMAHPGFKDDMVYAPIKIWTSPEKKERVYGDMWTADWWWKMQIRLRQKFGPATLVPLIIATDQTKLSTMCGGQKAYPVYVTVGNIGKDGRRKPSQRATVLLGYLPVDAFEDIEDDNERRRMKADLIHRSMETMLRPLQQAAETGIEMWCADGRLRRVYPMVAAYIADWPEQNLMACTSEGSCPVCVTKQKGRGDLNQETTMRDRDETLRAIRAYFDYKSKLELGELRLKPVWPWWASLPNTNFSTCLTPDLLHQLYQGIFKSHLVRWIQYLVGIKKLDSRFIATTQAAGMTHFGKGISRVQQWTGRESKEMLKQFLPLVVGDLEPELATLVTSAVEFIYRAHGSTMTDTDIRELDETLETFHRLKDLMVKKKFYGSSAHFDRIPKIHMLKHYSHSIRQLGTPDGYSTEAPEHLHIEYAKDPWRASNKVRPLPQMITYIQRMEAVRIHRSMMNQWLVLNGKLPALRPNVEDGCEVEDGREATTDEYEDEETAEVVRRIESTVRSTAGVTQSSGGVAGSGKGARKVKGIRGVGVAGGEVSGLKSAAEADTYYPEPRRQMAKNPTRPNLRVKDVIDDYGASDLKSAVADFLNRRFEVPRYNAILSENHRINVWHRLYLHHPTPPFAPLDPPRRDVVRASPTSLDPAGRTRKAGVWDVAMYLEKPNRIRECYLIPHLPPRLRPFHFSSPTRLPLEQVRPLADLSYLGSSVNDTEKRGIHRYRAGRVRAFFTLPHGLSRYYPGQLAYVEVFLPFNAGSSPTHGLHSTSWDLTSNGARRTLVLPVTDIVFSCHLSPKFHLLPRDLKLSAQTDLYAISQHFWFNQYYSHYMYQLLRHWRQLVSVAASRLVSLADLGAGVHPLCLSETRRERQRASMRKDVSGGNRAKASWTHWDFNTPGERSSTPHPPAHGTSYSISSIQLVST
ncbi:hypothetical protein RhiJN_09680 [Ceratobasidium sp. AG-Ba]|nr:hypothetical protein RhiJN_09680 [Ceratobasidium sp. AG-Ba]